MKTLLNLIPVLAICCISCGDGSKGPGGLGDIKNPTQTTAVLGHAAYNAMDDDLTGTYTGVLPCADCEGIAVELIVKGNEKYSLSQTYQGKGDGKPFVQEGKWRFSDNILTLLGVDGPGKYRLEENRLLMLTEDGEAVTGDLADHYILKKK